MDKNRIGDGQTSSISLSCSTTHNGDTVTLAACLRGSLSPTILRGSRVSRKPWAVQSAFFTERPPNALSEMNHYLLADIRPDPSRCSIFLAVFYLHPRIESLLCQNVLFAVAKPN